MDEVGDILKQLPEAPHSHDLKVLAGFIILILVSLFRKYGSKLWSGFAQPKVAWTTSLVIGVLWSVASAVVAGDKLDVNGIVHYVLAGATAGLTGSGIYSGVKELRKPAAPSNHASSLPPPLPPPPPSVPPGV